MNKYDRIVDWEDNITALVKESVSIAIGVYTLEGELLDANETMCIFLHTTPDELNAQNFFVNPAFAELNGKNDALVFNGLLTIGNYTDTSYVLQSKIYKKHDRYLVVAEADVKHLFDENRKMNALNREVTNLQRQLIKEKKRLENTLQELKETQQMLIHSEKMNAMGQLVAGVAHEINNPLSFVLNNIHSLKGYSQEILESYGKLMKTVSDGKDSELQSKFEEIREEDEIEYLSEDIIEAINESQNGVERAVKIVADLRRFSRLDESDVKHIDLIENIKSTLSIARSAMDKKQIQFELIAPEQLEIDCFPGQLNQALLNIIMNAVYAVKKNGRVVLKVEEFESNILIKVIDDGCGIETEQMAKIFDPFFTTKPVGEGTGLGLSITHKIIKDLHRGKINVKSEPKVGTEISLEIPIRVEV